MGPRDRGPPGDGTEAMGLATAAHPRLPGPTAGLPGRPKRVFRRAALSLRRQSPAVAAQEHQRSIGAHG